MGTAEMVRGERRKRLVVLEIMKYQRLLVSIDMSHDQEMTCHQLFGMTITDPGDSSNSVANLTWNLIRLDDPGWQGVPDRHGRFATRHAQRMLHGNEVQVYHDRADVHVDEQVVDAMINAHLGVKK